MLHNYQQICFFHKSVDKKDNFKSFHKKFKGYCKVFLFIKLFQKTGEKWRRKVLNKVLQQQYPLSSSALVWLVEIEAYAVEGGGRWVDGGNNRLIYIAAF